MANEINHLGPILQAIGRQIAQLKRSTRKGSHLDRDLPILLLPHAQHHPVVSDRHGRGEELPYLVGERHASEPAESEHGTPTAHTSSRAAGR
jgi:hypothetical protein